MLRPDSQNIGNITIQQKDGYCFENNLALFSLTGQTPETELLPQPYNDIFCYMLVCKGTAQLVINGTPHSLIPNTLVVLTPVHFVHLSNPSPNFHCTILLTTKVFVDSIPASDTLYKHITKVLIYPHRVNLLQMNQFIALSERIQQLRACISLKNHHFHREMVQNTLIAFFLELSNIWEENQWHKTQTPHFNKYEKVLKSFLDLLTVNYRKEHLVPFYASRLNISTQYLSLIVKRLTGQTVNQFIYERLYCEARALLENPELSIQQIADLLYFSDQSAFRKFFKRKNGLSPVEYRKKLTN